MVHTAAPGLRGVPQQRPDRPQRHLQLQLSGLPADVRTPLGSSQRKTNKHRKTFKVVQLLLVLGWSQELPPDSGLLGHIFDSFIFNEPLN